MMRLPFMRRRRRAMIIGLDCADPSLVFDRWREQLPNLDRVMRGGAFAPMRSSIPPITVPAWMSMMTSRDPGRLGFYGFRNRTAHDYTGLGVVDSRNVHEPTLWDVLGGQGKRSIVIGVPPTYPPKPMVGSLVTCFLTPDTAGDFTYPPELATRIRRLVGEYMVDVKGYRTDDKAWLLEQIYDMTDRRFRVARDLLDNDDWDLFMMVEMGTDRIHHGFWQFMDPSHVLHQPGTPFQDAIRQYYIYLDREVGTLLERADDDTLVMVVSDHGAKRMDGAICLNDWLIREGYLHLLDTPATPRRLEPDEVDWDRTRAWGEGGYYGRLSLNVRGREPRGIVAPADVDALSVEIAARLEALGDEAGNPIGTRVLRPDAIYRESRNIAPDLFVFFGDLYWRATGTVGNPSIHARENDTGPDGANHDWAGIACVATGRALRTGKPAQVALPPDLNLLDVTPTVLAWLGIEPLAGMQGRALPVA